MNKSTNKRNNYNTIVVKRLAEKWGVTQRFITMSLRDDRDSETAMSIKKEYKKLNNEIDKVLNQ